MSDSQVLDATGARGVSRRTVARQVAATTTLAAVGIAIRPGAARAQAGDPTTIGFAENGGISLEFVGSIAQNGFDFSVFGFVTGVAGVDSRLLFTEDDPVNRAAGAARLTLFGTGKGIGRAIHESVFMVDAIGEMGLFVNDAGGADFAEPESFGAGARATTFAMRIQNTVTVTAPRVGFCIGGGDLTIDATDPFTLDDTAFTFARAGLLARIAYNGQGTLIVPEIPESIIAIAGNLRF